MLLVWKQKESPAAYITVASLNDLSDQFTSQGFGLEAPKSNQNTSR